MKKVLVVFGFTILLSGILCSCGQQNFAQQKTSDDQIQSASSSVDGQVSSNSNATQDKSTSNVPDYATLAEPKDGKEAISVVSFSSEWSTEKYSYVYFTVRNDLEITVRQIYLSVVYLDKNGNIVDTGNASDSARVLPGQSIKLDSIFENSLSATAVYIDQYSYYDKEDQYHKFFVDNPEIYPIQ